MRVVMGWWRSWRMIIYILALDFGLDLWTESEGEDVDWWRQECHRPSTTLNDGLSPLVRKVCRYTFPKLVCFKTAIQYVNTKSTVNSSWPLGLTDWKTRIRLLFSVLIPISDDLRVMEMPNLFYFKLVFKLVMTFSGYIWLRGLG